jgi:PadR family transcriptional regulator, regulatory protein PadR
VDDLLSSWLAQTRKGVVELFVLELLHGRGPLHGYGIVQALDELGDIVAGLSTVYPVLKRLEADGLVVAEWETDVPGNPRKYYRITPLGQEFLVRAECEWRRLMAAMDTLKGEHA